MEEPEKAWLGLEPQLKLSGGDASRIPYIDVRIGRHSRMLLAGIQGTDGDARLFLSATGNINVEWVAPI